MASCSSVREFSYVLMNTCLAYEQPRCQTALVNVSEGFCAACETNKCQKAAAGSYWQMKRPFVVHGFVLYQLVPERVAEISEIPESFPFSIAPL